MSTRGYWVSVSKAFGATRTPKQCQSKWYVLDPLPPWRCIGATYRSETLRGKVENKGKERRWKEEDSHILACKCVPCSGLLFCLDTECIGLHLSMLMRRRTLIGSLSGIPLGICGVPVFFGESGNVSRPGPSATTMVPCAIVVSGHCSSRLLLPTYIPDRRRTSRSRADKADLSSRHFYTIVCLLRLTC